MKKQFTFLLMVTLFMGYYAKAQDYDVGVFYMPFWDKKWTAPTAQDLGCTVTTLNVGGESVEKYTNCGGAPGTGLNVGIPGHWNIMYEYNDFLASKYAWSDIRVPSNLYWPSPQWYNESWKHVGEKQHKLMADHGIDFVMYDSYFSFYAPRNKYEPFWTQALKNRLKSGFNDSGVEFGIFWAAPMLNLVRFQENENSPIINKCSAFFRGTGTANGVSGIEALADYWSDYMKLPDYKKIDGKPVFYIQTFNSTDGNGGYRNSLEGICDYCRNDPFFGNLRGKETDGLFDRQAEKTEFLIKEIEAALARHGVQTPLYKVAVVDAHPRWEWVDNNDAAMDNAFKREWLINHPKEVGFQATTAYQHFFFDRNDLKRARSWDNDKNCGNDSNDYTYSRYSYYARRFKDYSLSQSQLDYQIPVSAGWNRASLNYHDIVRKGESIVGPTPNNLYKEYKDCAISTPSSWNSELVAAKNRADAYASKTDRRIMLCCWNEYAEGTVIEPTTTHGTQYLEKVKSVFNSSSSGGGPDLPNPFGARAASEGAADLEVLELQVYPNPVQDFVSLRFKVELEEEITIDLLDTSGKNIGNIEKRLFTPGVHEITLNLQNLQGVYFFRMRSHTGDEVKRILIE